MSVLFITHNLGVVAEIAHDVVVMYAGRVVEAAPVDGAVRAPDAIPTRRACWPASRLRSTGTASVGGERPRLNADPGQGAERAGAAAGLRLRAALPVPHREMRSRTRRSLQAGPGASQPLLEA